VFTEIILFSISPKGNELFQQKLWNITAAIFDFKNELFAFWSIWARYPLVNSVLIEVLHVFRTGII